MRRFDIGESSGTSATSPNLHAPSSVAIKSLSNFSPFSALTSTITPSLKVNVNPSIMLPLRFKGNLLVTYPLTLLQSGAVHPSPVGLFAINGCPSPFT